MAKKRKTLKKKNKIRLVITIQQTNLISKAVFRSDWIGFIKHKFGEKYRPFGV